MRVQANVGLLWFSLASLKLTYLAKQVVIQNSEIKGKQSAFEEMLSRRGLRGWQMLVAGCGNTMR